MPILTGSFQANVSVTHFEAEATGIIPHWIPEQDIIDIHDVPRKEFDRIQAVEKELWDSLPFWVKSLESENYIRVIFYCNEPPVRTE